jgi:hypothetical protein
MVRGRSRLELGRDPLHPLAHHLLVLRRGPDVAQNATDTTDECLEPLRVGLAIDFELHDRFRQRIRDSRARRENSGETPIHIPQHINDRDDREANPVSETGKLHTHRIHQERHVIRNDFDDRARRLPAMLSGRRVVRPHTGGACLSFPGKVPTGHCRPTQVTDTAPGEIRLRHPVVEPPHERSHWPISSRETSSGRRAQTDSISASSSCSALSGIALRPSIDPAPQPERPALRSTRQPTPPECTKPANIRRGFEGVRLPIDADSQTLRPDALRVAGPAARRAASRTACDPALYPPCATSRSGSHPVVR